MQYILPQQIQTIRRERSTKELVKEIYNGKGALREFH